MSDDRISPSAHTLTNVPIEIDLYSNTENLDQWQWDVDLVFVDPHGNQKIVPAFYAGKNQWKARYSSSVPGQHHWSCQVSPSNMISLNPLQGVIDITPYTGENPLYKHGAIRVAPSKRYFEHADGTPFFWLGDTWWMGLCHRLHWPEEFQRLAADRRQKGFNVIQIVAGLYPDMFPFDPRGANETGYPWENDYVRIRPEYFDAADVRLRYLVEQGITPCIVGAWGYFMPWMGREKMIQHWRHLIARYGAWPVVWCAAGEANLPWYLADNFPCDDRSVIEDWTEVMRYIRDTDPFQRPLTIHPTAINRYTSRHITNDQSLLGFDMLQTPHGQREAVPVAVKAVRESYSDSPTMPVINGEASYEKLMDILPTEWTRAMFWLCLMNGTKGHTYGANGIWQVNRPGQPHGPSPTAGAPPNGYGTITWEEAMNLPGSTHVALGKKFFETLPWKDLVPMAETAVWADPKNDDDPLIAPQACGINDTLRVVYVLDPHDIKVKRLKGQATYRMVTFDPVSGERSQPTEICTNSEGIVILQHPAHGHDWVVILEG